MKIIWTRTALDDLDNAYEYIAANNPLAARDIIDRIENAIQRLLQYPQMGRVGQVAGTRELVITRTPFIVPYRVRGDRLEILAVIHSARDWPDSFKNLLLGKAIAFFIAKAILFPPPSKMAMPQILVGSHSPRN